MSRSDPSSKFGPSFCVGRNRGSGASNVCSVVIWVGLPDSSRVFMETNRSYIYAYRDRTKYIMLVKPWALITVCMIQKKT